MDVNLTERELFKLCASELLSNADATTNRDWNKINGKVVQLIIRTLHKDLLSSLSDRVTAKNTKALWNGINNRFSSQTIKIEAVLGSDGKA
ncbi:hypothetical protein O181_035007 [Austropuccinia psidii MF-1]|uniref:Uncharacterized protein n=1 Tax=Austropuccinia psidii MF-1 TaxID=1389203 RepID=A0A9Q3D4D5_9BASI|nr:hypothetical protein [Austropuccinia psidii MF-1]